MTLSLNCFPNYSSTVSRSFVQLLGKFKYFKSLVVGKFKGKGGTVSSNDNTSEFCMHFNGDLTDVGTAVRIPALHKRKM